MLRPIVLPLLIFVIAPSVAHAQTDGIAINEVMSSNRTTIADEDGDFEDWIELYNFGSVIVNLEGYGLSDDYDRPFRWSFPDTLIQPGEFLLVWASGKERAEPGAPLHTSFRIAAAGEEVLITRPDSTRVDELGPTQIPTDVSIGRQPDGTGEWFFFNSPTPGAPNDTDGHQNILESPVFSHPAGFYDGPFELTLSTPVDGAVIYYTLDGSEPSPADTSGAVFRYKNHYQGRPGDPDGELLDWPYHTYRYTRSIPVADQTDEPNRIFEITSAISGNPLVPTGSVLAGTVVRAIAVKEGHLDSQVSTRSFLVHPEMSRRYHVPVVSIAAPPASLFDYDEGIYVPGKIFDDWRGENPSAVENLWSMPANYHQRGIEWERRAHVEYFDSGGERLLDQQVGVRLHGGATRASFRKSLRLYARNLYGKRDFRHQLFPSKSTDTFRRFLLRNSGNDRYSTLFRDALMQDLIAHLRLDHQSYQPVILFLNGEYWGIHNLRDRIDRYYLQHEHGVDPENLDILTWRNAVKEGDNLHYDAMIAFVESNSMADSTAYAHVNTLMDVENFIDYQTAQIYFNNTDWPGNNVDFWRLRTSEYRPDAPYGHDGRWRWILFDTDFGFGLSGGVEAYKHNMLAFATAEGGTAWPNPDWSTFLLRSLLENDAFRHAFITRLSDHLNTIFAPAVVTAKIDSMQVNLAPLMQEHLDRWRNPVSVSAWNSNVDVMRTFAQERPAHQRQHIREFFDIEREVALAVDVSDDLHGSIRVNTIDIGPETPGIGETPYPWTGIYFSGIPINVHAAPAEGYLFSHWEGVDTLAHEPSVTLTLEDDAALTAVFVRESPPLEYPEPFDLTSGPYEFREWAETEPAGTFPESMAFVYMVDDDPGLGAAIDGFTSGAYDLETRTRINGLGPGGIAFINTSNEEGNPGYPGRKLGGALLVLDTSASDTVYVSWTGGTVTPNSRVYHLRLQYRSGDSGPFANVLDGEGLPVEYVRSNAAGHFRTFPPVRLSAEATGGDELQLLWRYYHTGERLDDDSGARDQLRLGDVIVSADAVAHLPAPQLVAPANDTSKAAPPTFRWEPALHATAYNLQIARDDAFGSMVLDTSGIEGTSYTYVGELEEGATYFWRVRAGHEGVKGAWSKTRMLTILSTVGVGETAPVAFELLQSYPNPFSRRAHIRYGIPQHAHVRVKVFNSLGQRVRILVDERQTPGWHEVKLDAADLPSGVYLYRLTAGDFTDTGALTLVR